PAGLRRERRRPSADGRDAGRRRRTPGRRAARHAPPRTRGAMTRATVCALLAGVVAALALADLAATRPRPRRRRPQRRGRAARLVPALVRLGRRLGAAGTPRDLAQRVAAAGSPLGLTAADVMAV